MSEHAVVLETGSIIDTLGLGGFRGLGSIGSVLFWIFIAMLIMSAISGFVIWMFLRRAYSEEVKIFGKVGGVPKLLSTDRGRFIRFGSAGDVLMHFRKNKKYQSPPTIQMGTNEWWFWKREDGELINIGLEDIDERMRRAGTYFVDTDMRMQRLGIQKNLEQRMIKQSFLEKYGGMIASLVYVIFVMIALVVLFTKLTEVAVAIDSMAGNVGNMAEKVEQFYNKRLGGEAPSDILNEGTGLTPAMILLAFKFRRNLKWVS